MPGGNRATKAFCDQNGIRYDNCGKMLVATSDLEMERMRALWERTAANGIEREWLNADELREREPNITGLGGILCRPAACQLPRRDGGDGKNLPVQRR